jgi:hypothetical protein
MLSFLSKENQLPSGVVKMLLSRICSLEYQRPVQTTTLRKKIKACESEPTEMHTSLLINYLKSTHRNIVFQVFTSK